MTRMSESKTRSVAAIGDSRVIPGERKRDPGSSGFADGPTTLDSRWSLPSSALIGGGNDGIACACVIPGEREARRGIQVK